MKHAIKGFLLSTGLIAGASAMAQGKVSVSISNIKNNNGVCRVCIFDNAAAFNGEGKPVQCVTAPVKANKSVALFENIPAGTYAISVFHDANNNNKFDVNFVGMPKEGYGASGNKLPFAAAPAFKANQFVLKNSQHLQLPIKLRNL